MRVQTRIWRTRASTGHPEQAHPLVAPPLATGVCISGGSTRSYAAAVGILRGLTETGLISKVGYLSAVSGGAWVAAPYTFYRGAATTDAEMLGRYEPPECLLPEALDRQDPGGLASAASTSFAGALSESARRLARTPDQVWCDAVGRVFLQPFGVFDPAHPVSFTADRRTAEDIEARNPSGGEALPHTVWSSSYRPYLLLHSTLSWPPDETDVLRSTRVGFEYAPLGVGTPSELVWRTEAGRTERAGGGYVEPFAFGGADPTASADGRFADIDAPEPAFSLADAVGASSAFRTADRDLRTYPHARCWAVRDGGPPTRQLFTDGGDLENYGLIPLLRRRVPAVLVFINTVWPLSLDEETQAWPDDLDEISVSRRRIDPFLAPLFGAPGRRFPHNRVFPESDYADVVAGLQRAKRGGATVMIETTHRVQTNAWWRVEGGWDVRVCWVYNDHVEEWVRALAPSLRSAVRQGQASSTGPFARFPHYLTRGQNPGALIRLTPAQTSLLAHLSSWNVIRNREALEACLTGP